MIPVNSIVLTRIAVIAALALVISTNAAPVQTTTQAQVSSNLLFVRLVLCPIVERQSLNSDVIGPEELVGDASSSYQKQMRLLCNQHPDCVQCSRFLILERGAIL